jgi:hypothetical protein
LQATRFVQASVRILLAGELERARLCSFEITLLPFLAAAHLRVA